MLRANTAAMSKMRSRLETYVVRNTGDLVEDLSDERREELAEVLTDLEGHGKRAAEAETRADELVEKLEHRNVVLAKARARIEELERDLAKARGEAGDQEQRVTEQLEAERVRSAEREQTMRNELENRETELSRRLETLDLRERSMRENDRVLSERERSLGMRESALETQAQELEGRTDERLAQRERDLDTRERELAGAEELALTKKHALEKRGVQVAETERAARNRAEGLDQREAKLADDAELVEQRSRRLAELEQQLDRRRQELDAYVARVQGSLPGPA
jgi:hypothetical protein